MPEARSSLSRTGSWQHEASFNPNGVMRWMRGSIASSHPNHLAMAQNRKSTKAGLLAQRRGFLTLGDWIGLVLGVLAVVLVFCLFFIRRNTLEYHLEHTFSIAAPEFFGSALALTDP